MSADKFHWEHYALLFFSDLSCCLLEGLRQHRQGLNSHLQDNSVKYILITNYSDITLDGQLSSARLLSTLSMGNARRNRKAPIANAACPPSLHPPRPRQLETWGNIDVTTALEIKEHHRVAKGSPLYKKMKERPSEMLGPGKWHCDLLINLVWV